MNQPSAPNQLCIGLTPELQDLLTEAKAEQPFVPAGKLIRDAAIETFKARRAKKLNPQ